MPQFIKLTEIDSDRNEKEIFIQGSIIYFMRKISIWGPDHPGGELKVTQIYTDGSYWPHVKETPEQIMEMINNDGKIQQKD
jgi:hypothetical protein